MEEYIERKYRDNIREDDLVTFEVKVKETDLLVSAEKDLRKETEFLIKKYRKQIEDYIECDLEFKTSFSPCKVKSSVPKIVRIMEEVSYLADVGPMASVAGAIAEFIGYGLLKFSNQIIVENGGDIFLKTKKERLVGIFAGSSPLSNKFAIKVNKDIPLGICTSSGTVGHSFSFGKADAITVVSKSTALADAVATSVGNIIKEKEDIEKGLKLSKKIKGIKGVVIIKDNKIGFCGSDISVVAL